MAPHAARLGPIALSALAVPLLLSLAATVSQAKPKERVLYSFSGGTDGGGPAAAVVFDKAGNLFGTAHFGGITTCGGQVGGGCGVVFELSPTGSTWTDSTLYAFNDGVDGGFPNAAVTLDGSGNLFGTASTGGSKICSIGCGVVYELSSTSSRWFETVLHTFTAADGQFPNAALFAGAGALYSTTWYGGAHGAGTVFSLTSGSSGWTEHVLYSFTGSTDGTGPAAGVIQDAAGNLYGTTYPFNGNNDGVAYALSPSGHAVWKDHVINTFSGASGGSGGENPYSGLIMDGSGNLYGTTIEGGPAGVGVVFELAHRGGMHYKEKVLHGFSGSPDGSQPYAGLVMDGTGNLYGTTVFGGATNHGSVFELQRSQSGKYKEHVLYSFTGLNDGGYPSAALIVGTDGNLYGTASEGGASNAGVVFEISS